MIIYSTSKKLDYFGSVLDSAIRLTQEWFVERFKHNELVVGILQQAMRYNSDQLVYVLQIHRNNAKNVFFLLSFL
jgi:hypothetical protein